MKPASQTIIDLCYSTVTHHMDAYGKTVSRAVKDAMHALGYNYLTRVGTQSFYLYKLAQCPMLVVFDMDHSVFYQPSALDIKRMEAWQHANQFKESGEAMHTFVQEAASRAAVHDIMIDAERLR